jgi:hypothetical protein
MTEEIRKEATLRLTKERIENAKRRISKCLNLLEATNDELDWMFEQNPEWDNAIQYQLKDAVVNLGFALATFQNWWEDSEEEAE